jgi:hypothetical protein
MNKSVRKNPHAVARGRLGGLVRSEAKQRANQENGRKGGLANPVMVAPHGDRRQLTGADCWGCGREPEANRYAV